MKKITASLIKKVLELFHLIPKTKRPAKKKKNVYPVPDFNAEDVL